MARRSRGLRMGWFSGYRVSYETWCQWTETLPAYVPPPEVLQPDRRCFNYNNRNEIYFLSLYVAWKERLPRRFRSEMPRPRYEKVEINTTPVSLFLPVRWVLYRSEDQIIPGRPGYNEEICKEIESDREQFRYFLDFIEEQGAPLSKDKVEFGWQKELVPPDDWRP